MGKLFIPRIFIKDPNRPQPPTPQLTKPEEEMSSKIKIMGREVPYYERHIPISQIEISDELPSFKSAADSGSGVVPGMRLEGSFESFGTGPIIVWERKDGRLLNCSGRHRHDLAARTEGVETIFAHVVREEDGVTLEMARFLDAEMNIRDGQGTVRDMARYLKYSDISDEELERRGWFARKPVMDAWYLGRKAIEDLYAMYMGGKIKEEQAIAITRAAPDDSDFQVIGIRYVIRNNPTPEMIRNFIEACRKGIKRRGTPETGDLFGEDDTVLREAEAMAKKAEKIQSELRNKLLVARSVLRRPEQARDMGIAIDDIRFLQTRIDDVEGELEGWKFWASDPDKVSLLARSLNPPPIVEPEVNLYVSAEDNKVFGPSGREKQENHQRNNKLSMLELPPLSKNLFGN